VSTRSPLNPEFCPAREETRIREGDISSVRDNIRVDRYGAQESGARSPERPIPAGEERELVAAVLRNDRKAAAAFVAAHVDPVYAYVRHRLLPRADLVDDVVQDVFLAALNGLRDFQGHSTLRTWVVAIARHKVDDVYRQRLRVHEPLDEVDPHDLPPAPSSIDESIDSARLRDRTRRVIARMPERYGLLLLWRYWEQRSTKDVAATIGATEKSVERMLARARACFKEVWAKER
jgi:RNA polymerase sigma-70 factor, ECF subfamily